MSERPDYLLDPAASPDPAIVALERALQPLRWQPVPLRHGALPPPGAGRGRRVFVWAAVAAAAVLLLGTMVVLSWSQPLRPDAPPRQFVARAEALEIPLGDLAAITLRPGSELQFVHWRSDQALFRLARGSLEARVAPPPKVQAGFFLVDTPLGRVVDQGCRYELVVHDDQQAQVRVTEGAVAFVFGDRTVFVPVGAAIAVTAAGPGTPVFLDADRALHKAAREYDAALAARASIDERGQTVKLVLAAARKPRDSLVLWHLLRDPEPEFRAAAEAHLLDLVGPADGGASKGVTFDPEEWLPFLRLGAWQGGG